MVREGAGVKKLLILLGVLGVYVYSRFAEPRPGRPRQAPGAAGKGPAARD